MDIQATPNELLTVSNKKKLVLWMLQTCIRLHNCWRVATRAGACLAATVLPYQVHQNRRFLIATAITGLAKMAQEETESHRVGCGHDVFVCHSSTTLALLSLH